VAMIESEPSAGNSWPGPARGSGRPSGTALPLAQSTSGARAVGVIRRGRS
jgi:hypothetical protein